MPFFAEVVVRVRKKTILVVVLFLCGVLIALGAGMAARRNLLAVLSRPPRHGELAVIRRLLAQGANVNTRDQDGWTPLHWAADSGRTESVRLLLAKGANANAKAYDLTKDMNQWLYSDIHPTYPVSRSESVRKRLLETPLKAALAAGYTDTAQILLDRGGALGSRDDLLLWAAENGHSKAIGLLLANGANVNVKDEYGWTPLHWAVYPDGSPAHWVLYPSPLHKYQMDKIAAVKTLLEHSADVNAGTTRKMTVYGIPVGIFEYEAGETPLRLALRHDENAIADILRKYGGKE